VNMAMTVHASSRQVQAHACAVIEVLAKNELNKDALLEAGTLDKMLQAGNRFKLTGLIIRAVKQMIFFEADDSQQTSDDDGHQTSIEAVISAGAIPMVTGWIGADLRSNQVLYFADFCLFVKSLVRLHTTTLLLANAHEIILGCMAEFPEPWLDRCGLHSLKLLVHFGEADAIDFFGDSRGMQLVYACVNSPYNVGFVCPTQANAINLLETIVRSYPKTTDHMVGAGLIPVLHKNMAQTMNRTRPTMHMNALVSMLSESNVTYRSPVVAEDIVPVMCLAQTMHRTRPIVHMNTLVSMLSTLASNVTYRSRVAAADILPTVCLAMQAFEHDTMFQTHAAMLLGYLNNSSSNTLESEVPSEVVRLVTQAMQNHEDNIGMQRAGV